MKTKHLILIIPITLVGAFLFGYINGGHSRDHASSALLASKDSTLNVYSTTLNKTKVIVSQQEQLIMTQREALRADSLTREELRKLNIKQANEITKLKLKIDTLITNVNHNGQIVHLDTVFLDKRTGNAILLPFEFNKSDKWLSLKGIFDGDGKLSVAYSLQTGVDLYVGIDKTTKKPTASLVSDNPYLKTISINSIKLDTPKNKRYSFGIQLGYGVGLSNGQLKTQPYIGLGLSYNIFRF